MPKTNTGLPLLRTNPYLCNRKVRDLMAINNIWSSNLLEGINIPRKSVAATFRRVYYSTAKGR